MFDDDLTLLLHFPARTLDLGSKATSACSKEKPHIGSVDALLRAHGYTHTAHYCRRTLHARLPAWM